MSDRSYPYNETVYGLVTIRPAMFDIDDTNLESGIEIKGDDIGLLEFYGYYDIENLTIDEIEEMIEDRL